MIIIEMIMQILGRLNPIHVELDVIRDSGVVTISRTFLGENSIILRLEGVISLKLFLIFKIRVIVPNDHLSLFQH